MRPSDRAMLLCAVCAMACARGGNATRPDSEESNPVLEAMKTEAPRLEEREVKAGGIRALVEARGPVAVEEDGERSMVLKIPIAEDEQITCMVKNGPLRAAETLRSFVRILARDSEIGVLGDTAVRVARDRPALFVEGLIRQVRDGGEVAFGHMKLMVAPTPPHAVACYMMSLGYAKTFQRITLGLVASLEPRGPLPAFIEIHEYSTAGTVLGFEHRRVWKSDDGTERSEVAGPLVVPISESMLSWQDVAYSEISDSGGRLKSFTYFRNSDDQKSELVLEQQSSGTYAVQGDVAGELVSGTLKTRDSKPVLSELGRNRATRDQLLTGKAQTFEVEAWVPGFDPLSFLPERFTRQPDGTIETVAGGATVRGTYDPLTGTPIEATTDLSEGRLLLSRRLFVSGRP